MTNSKPRMVAVVGPTASGKTSLAVAIAKQFNGEVISADSRQIYRRLDIGTAKITPDEMQGVPHHLVDIIDIDESYSAASFANDASAVIDKLIKNEKLPVIAGGTFFYLDTLLKKTTAPPVDSNPELRGYLEDLSTEMLFNELSRLDPERANTIDRNNKRRIIRALEIVHELGAVPPLKPQECPYNTLVIGLKIEKEILRERFLGRAQGWLKEGFKEEVTELLATGVTRDRLKEIGFEYSLMLELIDEKISEEEFCQKFIEKNWQYAKRQMTWLKRDNSVEWFAPQNRFAILGRVKEFLNAE